MSMTNFNADKHPRKKQQGALGKGDNGGHFARVERQEVNFDHEPENLDQQEVDEEIFDGLTQNFPDTYPEDYNFNRLRNALYEDAGDGQWTPRHTDADSAHEAFLQAVEDQTFTDEEAVSAIEVATVHDPDRGYNNAYKAYMGGIQDMAYHTRSDSTLSPRYDTDEEMLAAVSDYLDRIDEHHKPQKQQDVEKTVREYIKKTGSDPKKFDVGGIVYETYDVPDHDDPDMIAPKHRLDVHEYALQRSIYDNFHG